LTHGGPRLKGIADNFKTRDIRVFMLSNQLPLLEAGRVVVE
jgi:hypothetical protein